MITSFKKILAPTWQKIALTILLFLIINFLSVVLAFSTVGSGKGGTLDYISFFILMIINPGVFLVPLIGTLFINPGPIDSQKRLILQIFLALGPIIQIVYLYLVVSIVLHLKNRNKRTEAKNQDQVQTNKNIVETTTKGHFKIIFMTTLIILAILFVGSMGLAFYKYSENKNLSLNLPRPAYTNGENRGLEIGSKKTMEQIEKARQKFEQTGRITNWKTYTSKAGWFQVQYPSWWEVNSSDEGGFIVKGGSNAATGDLKNDIFSNSADDPNKNSIVIDHCHGLEYCKPEMERSLRFLTDTINITVGGVPAIKGYQRVPSRTYNTTVIIPRVILTESYKDAYYQFRLNGDLENQAIFENMINSFKFIQ